MSNVDAQMKERKEGKAGAGLPVAHTTDILGVVSSVQKVSHRHH